MKEILQAILTAQVIQGVGQLLMAGGLLYISLAVRDLTKRTYRERCPQCGALYLNPDCETCRARSGV